MNDVLYVSRSFARIYAEEIETLKLRVEVIDGVGIDRRKRKRLMRKARTRGRDIFFEKYGK